MKIKGGFMRVCIYLKGTEPELSFTSEEHIFPAGIGGIQKLPQGYVSHECNNAFSALELEFMRNSLIAFPRQFYGPGKRGNLSPKKATKSNVTLMSSRDAPDLIELGYISLGRPYVIPQLKIDINGTVHFISDRSFGEYKIQFKDFVKKLPKFDYKYILHEDERFGKGDFIIGYHDGKWHVALSNKALISEIDGFIEKILSQKVFENGTPQYATVQPKVHQTIQMDDRYFRTCAKIVFNYLAFTKGQEFVLNERFDPLRDWIVNGGENEFATLLARENNRFEMFSPIPFPELSHRLIITKIGTTLIGYISFYGASFETVIKLCTNFEDSLELEGYICDWQKRKEYSLNDFLNALHDKNESNLM